MLFYLETIYSFHRLHLFFCLNAITRQGYGLNKQMLNTPGCHAHALNHNYLEKYIFFINHVAKNVIECLSIQIGNLKRNDLKNTPRLRPSAVCT